MSDFTRDDSHRRFSRILTLIVFLLITSVSAFANRELASEQLTIFDAGNKAFEQGKYADAISDYEKVERSGGSSVALYFNLGNAYLKANQTGRAIVAYKMAKRLSPRDAEVRANLEFARHQVQGPTVYRNLWERWLDWFSLNEWTLGATCCFWILFAVLTLRQILPPMRSRFRILIPALALATALMALSVGILFLERSDKIVVVTAESAIAHQGPLDESPPAFTAHDGAELRLLDTKGDWFQVTADSRRVGWLRRNDATVPLR